MVGACESGDEPLGSVKRWEFLGFHRKIPLDVVVVVVVVVQY